MESEAFIARYPRLFHMAADGSWASIRERGLLSTQSLVELYKPSPQVRAEVLGAIRKRSYQLMAEGLPNATVRDQLPLKFLDQCLFPGTTVQDFLDELNGRVFFHVAKERLFRLLCAKPYRAQPHDVLVLDTAEFLKVHPAVDLAPYNTGSVHVPNMPARGAGTFVPLERYPWDSWSQRRGEKDAVVELTVRGMADVMPAVVRVEQWRGEECLSVLYEASDEASERGFS